MSRDDLLMAVIGSATAFSSGLLKIVVIENAFNALIVGFAGAMGGLVAKLIFESTKSIFKKSKTQKPE